MQVHVVEVEPGQRAKSQGLAKAPQKALGSAEADQVWPPILRTPSSLVRQPFCGRGSGAGFLAGWSGDKIDGQSVRRCGLDQLVPKLIWMSLASQEFWTKVWLAWVKSVVSNRTSVQIPSCQGHWRPPLMASSDEHVLRCILVFGQNTASTASSCTPFGRTQERWKSHEMSAAHQGYITTTATEPSLSNSLICLPHPNAPKNGCPRKVFVDHCLDLDRLLRQLLWKWRQRCCQLVRHLRGRTHPLNASRRYLGLDN